MQRPIFKALMAVALVVFAAVAADAEELTVNSILAAQQSGASAQGIAAMVNNRANVVAMTAGDIVTLRAAGVPETVLTAIWAHVPAPTPAPMPLQPDDARLAELVRLVASGMSESIIAEQVRQSGESYTLSVNDLLYLKQNGAQETTIAALMATGAGTPAASPVAPAELMFDNLELVKNGIWFINNDRTGRLVLREDTFQWEDDHNQKQNFTFETTGLDKVWYTCEARSSENFCHQINFKIVKGDRYRFRDVNRESGSNAAVVKIMDALRTYYPRLTYATPSVDD